MGGNAAMAGPWSSGKICRWGSDCPVLAGFERVLAIDITTFFPWHGVC